MRLTPLLLQIAALCLKRPGLIGPALAAGWRFRASDWYRRAPFLPVPPRSYVAWRFDTAFGSAAARPSDAELSRYLRWTRRMGQP